ELDRIFVRGYDLNEELLGKITFAQMVYLMLVGRMPSAEEGRMIDTMLIVLVDHGMTTGALAARMTYHSAPEALQGAVAAAILGAGSVHLGSSEYCAKMLNDALPPDSKEADLDTIAKNTVEKRLGDKQLIPGTWYRPRHSHSRRSAGGEAFSSGSGDQSLRPLLRPPPKNSQTPRRTRRPPSASERHRRHRLYPYGHGAALANVQVRRHTRPRSRRHRSRR